MSHGPWGGVQQNIPHTKNRGRIYIKAPSFDSPEEILNFTSRKTDEGRVLYPRKILSQLFNFLSPSQLTNIARASKKVFMHPREAGLGPPENRAILRQVFEIDREVSKYLFTQCGEHQVCTTGKMGLQL